MVRTALILCARLVASAGTLALTPPAEAHDWYTELASPSGEACCTRRDCEAADHRYDTVSGRLEVRVAGMWVPVDRGALLPVPSPDGRTHVCWWRHWTIDKRMKPEIRCVILPGEV
jgi:hypothetical protein